MTDTELQTYLHEKIPITRAMGFTIAGAGPEQISIAVPLALNGNHQGTAFGGSISAALTTAAWACVHIAARQLDENAVVVVREGTTHYDRPLHNDFVANASFVSEQELARMHTRYSRSGRVKVRHTAEIRFEGEVAASFTGSFVILAPHVV
ncbi:MAG: YiiD C-terminal domain-containing protein [Spirochaetota bacterium]